MRSASLDNRESKEKGKNVHVRILNAYEVEGRQITKTEIAKLETLTNIQLFYSAMVQ